MTHSTFVYFVRGRSGGPIKIGRARNVERRLASLQSGSPVPLEILASAPATEFDEAALHHRFAHVRARSEWFEPCADLLALIHAVSTKGVLPALDPVVSVRQVSTETGDVLAHIYDFLAKTGMSETAFGIAACNDGKLCLELRRGRRLWPETADKIFAHMQSKRAA